jgi:hypothetical protein
MRNSNITDILDKLESVVSQRKDTSVELTELFLDKNIVIPPAIHSLLASFDDVTEIIPVAFLGYDLIDEKKIVEHYRSSDKRKSFFAAYDCIDGFNLSEEMCIYLEDQLDMQLDESEIISNLENYMPLFRFQGDYIVLDLSKNSYGSLLTIVDGHLASYLAPSISQHISDLIDGLDQGVYKVVDEDIVYPTSWYQRCLVRSGLAKMDEFGELVE